MSIKVIGEAREAVKQAVCRHCDALLEYTRSDVRTRHGKDYLGDPDGFEWIPCPRCGTKVILKAW